MTEFSLQRDKLVYNSIKTSSVSFHQDKANKRWMLMAIDRRKKKLKVLRRTRYDSFEKVCQELGITYTFPPEYYRRVTRRWLAKKAFCNKVMFSAQLSQNASMFFLQISWFVFQLLFTLYFLPFRSFKRSRNKKQSRERNREQRRLRERSQHPLQNHKKLWHSDVQTDDKTCVLTSPEEQSDTSSFDVTFK